MMKNNPTEEGDCIKPDGTVDLEGLLKKYENPAMIGEYEARRHYVRMTAAQRSVFFTVWYYHRAEPIRKMMTEKYGLTPEQAAIDDNIVDLQDYEKASEPCKGCDGKFCKFEPMQWYSQPFLEYDGNRIRFKHRECEVHREYLRAKYRLERLEEAGVPARYHNLTFDDYKVNSGNKSAVLAAVGCIANTNLGLFIYGKCGVGKSMLAAIIANEADRSGRQVEFMTVPRLLQRVKSTFDNKNEDTQSVLDRLERVDLLIFDDFGSEKPTEWTAETLFTIVNERYQNNKQTIFTSNLPLDKIAARLNGVSDEAGTRIASRISAMCMPVTISGSDRRMKN